MNLRKITDRGMRYSIFLIGGFNVVIVFLIFLFILTNSIEAFKDVPVSKFFLEKNGFLFLKNTGFFLCFPEHFV